MKNQINQFGKEVIDLQIKALKKLKNSLDDSFEKAVKEINKCKSKVIICGVGKSGKIASKISATLSSVGTPSFSISASDCSHGDVAHYLFHEGNKDSDLGWSSLQCGRRNDALKLWLAWREIGDSGWAKMVEKYCGLADYLEQKIVEEPNLEMMSSREWTNVCFRYNDQLGHSDLNYLNAEIRDRLLKEGEILVSRSNIAEDVVIRSVISNPSVSAEILDRLVEKVKLHASEIISGIPPTN